MSDYTEITDDASKSPNDVTEDYRTDGAPFLSEQEQRQLELWNATQRKYPRHACVPHVVAAQAAATPRAIALVAGGQALTYEELDRRASQLASRLHSQMFDFQFRRFLAILALLAISLCLRGRFSTLTKIDLCVY